MKYKPEVFRTAQTFLATSGRGAPAESGIHVGICTCILAACYTPEFSYRDDYGLHIGLAQAMLQPPNASAYWWPYPATDTEQCERFIALELLALIAEDL